MGLTSIGGEIFAWLAFLHKGINQFPDFFRHIVENNRFFLETDQTFTRNGATI